MTPDRKAPQDLRERRAFKAWLVLKANRGRKDHKVRRVSRVIRATEAIPARRTSAQCRPMER